MNNKISWIKRDLIGFSLTSLFNDLSHEMTTSLLPIFVEGMVGPAAPLALGVIMGCADAIATVMKLVSGMLVNYVRSFKPILLIGYALTPLCVGLIGMTHHIWQILVLQSIAWMGRGLREPMRDVWITNIAAPADYGKTFGLQRAFDTIGAILGPSLAFFLIGRLSLRSSFFIAFIPGLFSVLSLLLLTSNYIRQVVATEYRNWRSQLTSLPAPFKRFLIVMFIFGIGNFHKSLLIYQAHAVFLGQGSSNVIATGFAIGLYILFNCMRACAEFSIGFLSDYVSRTKLLAWFGFGLFAIVNVGLISATSNLLWWLIIFITGGISIGTVTSLEKSHAAQLLPAPVQGIGFGLLQSVDGIGDLLSSVVVGAIWTYISPEIAFMYAVTLSIIAMVLLLRK